MFQVRFHGRGGQGVVTAAELLASAAFLQDRYAQAFPSFGSERMGAPVMSFCRIDDKPIRTHEPVTEPDALVIQDPTLLPVPASNLRMARLGGPLPGAPRLAALAALTGVVSLDALLAAIGDRFTG